MQSTIRKALGLGVIGALLSLPLAASALTIQFLQPWPTNPWQKFGTDFGNAGHVAPWHAWTAGDRTNICVGNGGVCTGLPGRTGSWQSQASTSCNNGSNPNSGTLTNTTYTIAVCPAPWVATQGVFAVDAFPFGSTP